MCLSSPNIQTSLAEVKRLKFMDSGAIHLIGNRVTEAVEKSPLDHAEPHCAKGQRLYFRLTTQIFWQKSLYHLLCYLYSILHPQCISTDQSLQASHILGLQLTRSEQQYPWTEMKNKRWKRNCNRSWQEDLGGISLNKYLDQWEACPWGRKNSPSDWLDQNPERLECLNFLGMWTFLLANVFSSQKLGAVKGCLASTDNI